MSVDVGTVTHLQVIPQHRGSPRPLQAVRAVVDQGLEGDVHSYKPKGHRQVLIVNGEGLAALGLRPGDLREQITVHFPGLDSMPAGTLLRIGQGTFELIGACDPCTHIGTLMGVADPKALEATLEGRRGQLARVVAIEGDGMIRIGDPVVPVDARDAARA